MATTYPFYTPTIPDFWVSGVPFDDTSGAGMINGSEWMGCRLRMDSFTNSVLSGALYFSCTTLRKGYSLSHYSAGSSYGPFAKPYYTSVAYSLVFDCYNSSGSKISTITPINKQIIYQVSADTTVNNKMYNWTTSNKTSTTCEPWVIRYASDKSGNLYNRVSMYYNENGKFRYGNRSNVTRNHFADEGWKSFSITVPQGTTYLEASLKIYRRPNSQSSTPPGFEERKSIKLYGSSGQNTNPIVIDNDSKINVKPFNTSVWNDGGRIWYKAANSTTWEKKFLYKKPKASSSWTKV